MCTISWCMNLLFGSVANACLHACKPSLSPTSHDTAVTSQLPEHLRGWPYVNFMVRATPGRGCYDGDRDVKATSCHGCEPDCHCDDDGCHAGHVCDTMKASYHPVLGLTSVWSENGTHALSKWTGRDRLAEASNVPPGTECDFALLRARAVAKGGGG
jgi:hypothetical protein